MKSLKSLIVLLVCSTLWACGGGGGSAGTPLVGGGGTTSGTGTGGATGSSATTSLLLSISSTTATAAVPATVTATVLNSTGGGVSGQVVKFSTSGGLGAFNANSALTNANGVATVTLTPAAASSNGADLVIATATVNAVTLTQAIGFQVTPGTGPTSPAGAPSLSVALSTTALTSTTPAAFTAVLKDANGVAVQGAVVNFSTATGTFGSFNPSSALSDPTGTVTSTLSASTNANGADLAIAKATVGGAAVIGSIGFSVTSAGAPASGSPSISLSLSTTTVTTATPAVVSATVRDATGAGVVGQVVKFTTISGLGSLPVSSALTNGAGVATVNLLAGTLAGADQVVATTTVNGSALQASQGFQLTVPNVGIASFVSDIPMVSAYGQSNLAVTLSGATPGTPVAVSVSSACFAKGKATLTPLTVTTTTGVANFTYKDGGCGATDSTDTLQANVGVTAKSLVINLTPPSVTSIGFVSASPQSIFLRGSGYAETSTVTFRVLDNGGNGLQGQSVVLTPSTLTGGLTIDGGAGPVTKLSDNSGNVSVLITSGTVPTPVRVTASVTVMVNGLPVPISTVSSSLSIAVGLPSQLNFSLSQATHNIEAMDHDGVANTYTIIASDRLGNPVPVGTSINFVAEAGQIEPIKQIQSVNGISTATANFVSSEPRPADGRVTVLVYALGEESFLDLNGDNKWDLGEPFQDLGDVYLDRAFNGVYDPAVDQFFALQLPAVVAPKTCVVPTSPLLQLDVSIPSAAIVAGAPTCDGTWGQAYVRRAVETVFSTSSALPHWNSSPAGLYSPDLASCNSIIDTNVGIGYDASGNLITSSFIEVGGPSALFNLSAAGGTLSFIASDANVIRLNPMAAGTTISATGTTGLTVAVLGGSPVPNTTTASFASVSVLFTSAASGTVTVSFTSPLGLTTSVPIGVSTGAPPGSWVSCHL